jgi:hypothetical protein
MLVANFQGEEEKQQEKILFYLVEHIQNILVCTPGNGWRYCPHSSHPRPFLFIFSRLFYLSLCFLLFEHCLPDCSTKTMTYVA